MKRVLITLLLCSSLTGNAGSSGYAHNAPIVMAMIRKWHPQPPVENDQFYDTLLHTFIGKSDPDHVCLLQADVDSLLARRSLFRQEVNGNNHQFIHDFSLVFSKRVATADSFIDIIGNKPLAFTLAEYHQHATSQHPQNITELHNRWRQYFKSNVLSRMAQAVENDTSLRLQNMLVKEPYYRERALRQMKGWKEGWQSNPGSVDTFLGKLLCQVICDVADPHTEYFSAAQQQDWKESVTGDEAKFGFSFGKNEKQETVIDQLAPGEPAWRCGEISTDDVVLAIREPDMQWFDAVDEELKEVNRFFARLRGNQIQIRIRKSDGSVRTISLTKEKTRPEENSVHSWILSDSLCPKTGYIYLPSFYTPWELEGGLHCFDDVAKELVKLMEDSVQSLILDLRNNGGGSLEEAQYLTGMFIEEGVEVIIKTQAVKPYSIKDPNRGTFFSKPMIVLVNGATASASELMAGALQDYHRAIIMGSNTYGKATMQVLLPVDSNLSRSKGRARRRVTTEDQVKLTDGLLYRPTGRSNQSTGVVPDIELPNLVAAYGYAEKWEPHCLTTEPVKAASYFTPLPALPVENLRSKSMSRMDATGYLKHQQQQAGNIAAEVKASKEAIPLKWEEFLNYHAKLTKRSKQLDEEDRIVRFKITNHTFDLEQLKVDRWRQTANSKSMLRISKDPLIAEALHVLFDLHQLNNH